MKTKFMFISCTLALIMSAAVLWAQEMPTSPTNDATAGIVAAEADQFMSTLEWGSVSFNKAFVYLDYTAGKHIVDIGAAFKAGPVYIGSYYNGDFGSFNTVADKQTLTTEPTFGPTAAAGTFHNVKRSDKTEFGNNYGGEHKVAMLIGYGNMGFQVGYKQEGKSQIGKYHGGTKKDDSIETNTGLGGLASGDKTTYDPKGFVKAAKYTPYVAFGMNIPVGAMTISPTAALEVAVNQNAKYGLETKLNKKDDTHYKLDKDSSGNASEAYTGITAKVGAGIDLGGALNSYVNIGYEFTVNAYGKTYQDLAGGKHKVKGTYEITADTVSDDYNSSFNGIHTVTKTFKADITEKTYFKNALKPEYSLQKDFTDRLSLFAKVECPITVTVDNGVKTKINKTVVTTENLQDSNVHANNTVTTVVSEPTETKKITTVEVEPAAMAAITYAAIPNRLSLNLGTKIGFLKGKHTHTKISKSGVIGKTTTTTVYENQKDREEVTESASVVKAEESVENKGTLNPVEAEVKGGLTWNITENFIFDFVYTHFLDKAKLIGPGALKIACTVKF